jgi:hypothetical protein
VILQLLNTSICNSVQNHLVVQTELDAAITVVSLRGAVEAKLQCCQLRWPFAGSIDAKARHHECCCLPPLNRAIHRCPCKPNQTTPSTTSMESSTHTRQMQLIIIEQIWPSSTLIYALSHSLGRQIPAHTTEAASYLLLAACVRQLILGSSTIHYQPSASAASCSEACAVCAVWEAGLHYYCTAFQPPPSSMPVPFTPYCPHTRCLLAVVSAARFLGSLVRDPGSSRSTTAGVPVLAVVVLIVPGTARESRLALRRWHCWDCGWQCWSEGWC